MSFFGSRGEGSGYGRPTSGADVPSPQYPRPASRLSRWGARAAALAALSASPDHHADKEMRTSQQGTIDAPVSLYNRYTERNALARNKRDQELAASQAVMLAERWSSMDPERLDSCLRVICETVDDLNDHRSASYLRAYAEAVVDASRYASYPQNNFAQKDIYERSTGRSQTVNQRTGTVLTNAFEAAPWRTPNVAAAMRNVNLHTILEAIRNLIEDGMLGGDEGRRIAQNILDAVHESEDEDRKERLGQHE